jgi:hypothetical protein
MLFELHCWPGGTSGGRERKVLPWSEVKRIRTAKLFVPVRQWNGLLGPNQRAGPLLVDLRAHDAGGVLPQPAASDPLVTARWLCVGVWGGGGGGGLEPPAPPGTTGRGWVGI